MTTSTRRGAAALSALAVAAALVLTTSYGAVGGAMVTGKDVKNNSITGKDVKNGSLAAADFKPGQLPAGATGPAGPAGPAGKNAPEPTVVTWTGSSPANGDAYRVQLSPMTVPARSALTGLSLTATNSTACPAGFTATAYVPGKDNTTIASIRAGSGGPTSYDQAATGDQARPIRLTFRCTSGDSFVPFGKVDFSLTFAYTTFGAATTTWTGGTVDSDD